MDTFLGLLAFAAFVAVFMFIRSMLSKGVNAVATAANKNLLFRSEYKEQQEFVNEPLVIETSASAADIMRALSKHITAEIQLGFVPKHYISLERPTQIVYAYGSNLYPVIYDVEVEMEETEDMTKVTFSVLHWTESEGMIKGFDGIKQIRKQVKAAVLAAELGGKDVIEGSNNT